MAIISFLYIFFYNDFSIRALATSSTMGEFGIGKFCQRRFENVKQNERRDNDCDEQIKQIV